MANRLTMASSSQPPKKYDAFISFRGEDIRFNFTSHLYAALSRNHIDTFIDYRLEKGEEVWPSLVEAIEDSTLFLVIFSENYASSTWCLKELSKILECSKNLAHHVLPVFYKVDPSHVRWQKSGSYQKAFKKFENERSINKQQLQKWREDLTHAANLSGWHCCSHSNEAELIAKIVQTVEDKLKKTTYHIKENLEGLIGIHRRMAVVESLLHKDSNGVQCVAIWGMGGMGKTTLARALFNRFCSAYDGVCLLDNIAEESKKNGIPALEKTLILELLGDKEYKNMYTAKRALCRKKVFIVLDDVNDPKQIEGLAGKDIWFGPNSKILITTRDKQVVLGKEVDDIYEMEALNVSDAFHLFSSIAFRNDYDDPKIRELAGKVIKYAGGTPLALKVLGALLNGKSREAWESQLKKLQKLPCEGVNDILKLSFEGLKDDEEKNIFLHIVCFLDQYPLKDVTNWLDASGYSAVMGLERLKDKALLDIQNGRICMHHLIKEMGLEIVRKKSYPQMRVHIWSSNNTIVSETTEGILLDASEEFEEMCLNHQAFNSMPKLRFLIFHNDSRENKLKFPNDIEFLSNKLILLCWTGYPFKSLPSTFTGEHLVQIKMPNSKLTKLWDGEPNLTNLREIVLKGSKYLIEIPNFTKAIHLATVDLNGCSKLRSIHPSILSLHSLCRLYLRNCEALTSLTSNTHLKSLKDLRLVGCSRLSKFSVTSEQREFQLDLSRTAINDELCSSSGQLSKICRLWMHGCKSVTSLNKLFNLGDLEALYVTGCNKVASNLRSILDEMHALQALCLTDCSELLEVPDNISKIASLFELDLSRTNIETLPSSIKHLSSLRRLLLNGCKRLQSLPQLHPSIAELSVNNCVSLKTIHLSHIHLYHYSFSYSYFSFQNCLMMDEQSIKAAEVNMLLKTSKAMDEYDIRLEYPGGRVPEWFMYRSNQSSLTVDLPSIPQPWNGSFFLCAIISKSPLTNFIMLDAGLFIDGQQVWLSHPRCLFGPILSDHVILWCDGHSCREVQRKIEEKIREIQDNTYHPLLQIQFTLSSSPEGGSTEIKQCGACPTSALYIQQLQLALQLRCHLESSNITSLMSLENLIPSLKALMLLQNLILSYKSLKSLKNLVWRLKARKNLKNLITSVKALMILKDLIPSLKALRNLKNLILFLEIFMNLKNFTFFDELD